MIGRGAAWRGRRFAGYPFWDLVLAAAALAVAITSVLTGNPDEGPALVTLPVAIVTAASLAWRRRSPLVGAAMVIVAGLTQTIFAESPGSLWSLVIYAIVMYSVAAAYTEGRAAIIGLLFLAALLLQEKIDNGVDYLFIVLLFGGIWLLGRASRLWRTRVTRAEQHRLDLARLAVAEERVRIARELHDILAHSLSVMAVQADAAEAAIQHDPALAHAPLKAIKSSARQSLHEIRDLLHVLRADEDEETALRPAPGLALLDELIESAGRAGVTVVARIELSKRPLPPVADLAAYRILQEALTNVARHAGSKHAELVVTQRDGQVELEVTSPFGPARARADGAGVGLLGIRERVAAVGGAIETGRVGDSYRVHAVLPVDEDRQ